ncbi:MAG: PHP domain-containing protein [Bacteroidales bacterium]|nr:PHP domain-containing protein [Bacteroidales bacterium]
MLGSVFVVLLILFTPPLYRRFAKYPGFEIKVNEFQKLRKEPASQTRLNLYRGVMHVHSYWSHDSEGTLEDLIPAAKINDIDFIFLTDHPHGNIDTLPRGYSGIYDNVLIVPGSEKQGFDAWPLDSAFIDWSVDKDTIAKNIVKNGGIVFYAHPEEDHNWGNQWYQGMEIYNFHADTRDESLIPVIANFIVNGSKYPQWSFREMFDEQTAILSRWDSLNTKRKLVGFSAVDTHENQNIRARYIQDGRIEWVGPNANVIDTSEVAFWNKWLLHPPDKSGWIFRMMIDTYREGFTYITNYVFADALSVPSLSVHIKKGHLYTAFRSLGEAGGFMFDCIDQSSNKCGMMGDSITLDKIRSFNAVSPLPGQFRLIHDGKLADSSSYNCYEYKWEDMIEKGAYRMEVYIKIGDKELPWIYSNPIYIY